jgi:hypothetical protein
MEWDNETNARSASSSTLRKRHSSHSSYYTTPCGQCERGRTATYQTAFYTSSKGEQERPCLEAVLGSQVSGVRLEAQKSLFGVMTFRCDAGQRQQRGEVAIILHSIEFHCPEQRILRF